jgi:hypothetical protein
VLHGEQRGGGPAGGPDLGVDVLDVVARVGLLAEWLSSYRPAAEPDLEHSGEPGEPLLDFG